MKRNGLLYLVIFSLALNVGAIGTFALAASEYMQKFGITEEQAARVAVKNRRNACLNPHAHLRKEVSVEEVLSSRVLAHPACGVLDDGV